MNELHGYYLEDLSVGMSASYAKTITEADIVSFAGLSGDTNPVHLNQKFANKTRFGGRIAHGMLSASFISTVLGTKLPGPGCIYLSQNMKFKAPVKIGDTVLAKAIITKILPEKKHVTLKTECLVGEMLVIDGEAVVLVNAKSSGAS